MVVGRGAGKVCVVGLGCGKETEIGSGVGKLTVRGPGVGKVAVVCVGGGKVAVKDPGGSIFFHFTILQPNNTSHRRVKYYERYCYTLSRGVLMSCKSCKHG